jgi:hypothetical protein
MPDVSNLLSDAERIAEMADSLSEWFAGELADVLRRLERRLSAELDAIETEVTGDLEVWSSWHPYRGLEAARREELKRDLQRALLARANIRDFLTTAGYDELVAAASVRGLDALATQVLTTGTAQTVASVPQSLSQQIAGLQSFLGLDLLDQGDVIAQSVWRAVMRGVIAGEDRNALIGDLAETLDRSVAQVRTLYDTSVSVYARQVEALQSTGESDEAFLYAGPVDGRVRPFCFDHVGKVFTRAEIDRMDNGQIPNVMLSGGGYNCRHQFVAVSKFSQLQDLAGTDKRLPEVASRLKSVTRERKAA